MSTDNAESVPGPPYPPSVHALGEVPSVIPDVPVNVVFLVLFLLGGAAHMTILQVNERRHHKKFPLNGATFGFCVTRVAATALRIAWATDPQNVPVGIASTVFFYAGVVLLFIANLFFAQRIVRAQHPLIGWSWPFSVALPAFIFVTVATILSLIAAIVIQFYTMDERARQASRGIQLYGSSFYAFMAFIPIPVVGISSLARLHPSMHQNTPVDKFGEGSMRTKVIVCLLSGILLALGAFYRAGTSYLPPVPTITPDGDLVPGPWYFRKAAFYSFNFAMEALVVWMWVIIRIDKRFHVPNGAIGAYSYAGGFIFAGEVGNEKREMAKGDSMRSLVGGSSSTSKRSSWDANAKAIAAHDRMSWGGISREDVQGSLGEDGVEIMPYAALDNNLKYPEADYNGEQQEMGWDAKRGRWALRPIVSVPGMRQDLSEPQT